ncbi:MAG: carboxypeptidase-like regulatory domain-containing protein [Planctomycetota bacterium]
MSNHGVNRVSVVGLFAVVVAAGLAIAVIVHYWRGGDADRRFGVGSGIGSAEAAEVQSPKRMVVHDNHIAESASKSESAEERHKLELGTKGPTTEYGVWLAMTWSDTQAPAADLTVTISLVGGKWRKQVLLDARGECVVPLDKPGLVYLIVETGETFSVPCTGPPENPIELVLQPGGKAIGKVVDEGGATVAGASALLCAAAGRNPERVVATTEHDGRFSLRRLPIPCFLRAESATCSVSTSVYIESYETEERVEIVLLSGVDVEVRIQFAQPLVESTDVVLKLTRRDRVRTASVLRRMEVEVGQDVATSVLAGVPPGEVELEARALGVESSVNVTLEDDARPLVVLELDLLPRVQVHGRVESSEGDRVPNAIVEASSESRTLGTATSDGQGEFTLSLPAAAQICLIATRENVGSAVRLLTTDPGQPDPVLVLRKRGLLVRFEGIEERGVSAHEVRTEWRHPLRQHWTAGGIWGCLPMAISSSRMHWTYPSARFSFAVLKVRKLRSIDRSL